MDSPQIDEPPSPAKRELIRRFLRATGIQRQIDSGSFLERHAMPGTPLFARHGGDGATFGEAAHAALSALRAAYEKHRPVWQEEYERHANWEFTEEELERIVRFLEGQAGQHFLEGRWRMDAYIGTNTEALVEEIVREACASA
jgi:hypothetical protein